MNREELKHNLAHERKHEVVLGVLYTRSLAVMMLTRDMLRSNVSRLQIEQYASSSFMLLPADQTGRIETR